MTPRIIYHTRLYIHVLIEHQLYRWIRKHIQLIFIVLRLILKNCFRIYSIERVVIQHIYLYLCFNILIFSWLEIFSS